MKEYKSTDAMNKTADYQFFFSPDIKYSEICMFSSIHDRFHAIISLRQTVEYSYEELQGWNNYLGHLPR